MYKLRYINGNEVEEIIVNSEDIDIENELNNCADFRYLCFKKYDGKIIYVKEDYIISIEEL